MKKNQKILLAAALLALGAASCQKEENVITQFTAGMEQTSAKTTLGDDNYFYWGNTDVVKVYSDGDNGSDFTVTPRADNGTWAVLRGTIAEGDSYTAIYPASIAASATSVTLPAVQTSPDGSLAEFPMYAESATDEFQFKNLCGALRIHLQASDVTISSIKVKASSNINGTYSISTTTEGIPQLGDCTNGTATTTLILGNAQSVSGADGRDFYVYLPAGEYGSMQLTFCQPNGAICTKSGSNVTVERSKCTPVEITNSLTFSFPEDCIHGLFSVSATKQVRFSNGNLQCVSGTWRFAEHQYDYFDTYNEDDWDHFGWSATAPVYGMSISTTIKNYSGNFNDWGTAINPSNGDTPWRTLSKDEWTYLLGRDGKYGLATITVTPSGASASTGVHGLVILPDSWSYNSINAGITGSGYSANEYTAAQWAQMDSAGAVFLPAAGKRLGTDMCYVGEIGSYWSSSVATTTTTSRKAYAMRFDANTVVGDDNPSRHAGQPVRLVQDY